MRSFPILAAIFAAAPGPGWTASPPPESAGPCCAVTLRARVPEGTGPVYLAGSLPELGPWRPNGRALDGNGRDRSVRLSIPAGVAFEYKFTLGSWDREALGPGGTVPPDHRLLVQRDTVVVHEIGAFKRDPRDYIADWRGSGVQGRLVYWTDVKSTFLGPPRHVEIWLPPGYDEGSNRYPVLYMSDGQNLFDPRIANTGVDWGVDEAVVRLVRQGVIPPLIVVGVWSTAARGPEYSPWHDAPAYARFLIEELMPRVNREFRTRTGPDHTAVMGSSMGGLLSFYLVTHHPDVFGTCGCISTHFPLSEAAVAQVLPGIATAKSSPPDSIPYILRDIQRGIQVPKGVRYWFDYGSRGIDSTYAPTHRGVRTWLLGQGLVEGRDFVIRSYQGATHNEASWRARLDDPLRFLFGNHQGGADHFEVASPNGRNRFGLALRDGGLYWSLTRDGRSLVLPSRLGFEFRGAPPLRDGLSLEDTSRAAHDETWTQPWGEVARVRDRHNELSVTLAEVAPPARRFTVRVRTFDDGIGFRYEVPEQPGLGTFEITEELTEFAFADNSRAWWIPSDRPRMDRSEMLYSSGPLSLLQSVQTPLTMETRDGRTFLVIHEANLVDYARMNLKGGAMEARTLRTDLAPYADGIRVRGHTPFVTPWRTIQLADRAEDLAPSVLGLNLNPPNVLPSTNWIKPMKYVGIWWGMHIGSMTWSSGPRHGATTANAKRYVDFAATNGFGGVLVEGWNVGWDGDWIQNRNAFSFTKPYPEYDLAEVARYARQRGVRLILHNETSGGIENYERQLDSAFTLYRSLGVDALKTGYVTDTTAEGHSHWSQYMVRHYRRVIEAAARYGIMLDVHEPLHDTGERRTYPNMMTREGSRGQEYNAWSGDGGNPPEHETILFFTRLLAGPMDFTPGIFDLLLERGTGRPRRLDEPRVRTTLAKQLALYVVLYSPLQMAADLPEHYAKQPGFRFIRDVAVDWDTTRVLAAKIGDYVAVARRERGGQTWFVGAITDEAGRTLDLPLSFLAPGRQYVAEIYADGPGAHWLDNPFPLAITRAPVTRATRLRVVLAPGGGQAIRIRPR